MGAKVRIFGGEIGGAKFSPLKDDERTSNQLNELDEREDMEEENDKGTRSGFPK